MAEASAIEKLLTAARSPEVERLFAMFMRGYQKAATGGNPFKKPTV